MERLVKSVMPSDEDTDTAWETDNNINTDSDFGH